MGRQLFLHHYLPAHLASCLVTGALVEFIFNVEPVLDDIPASPNNASSPNTPSAVREKQQDQRKARKHFQTASERLAGQSLWPTWIAVIVIMIPILYGFMFFFPLTYGWPGLDVVQVNRRKWLGYDLHFAK
jgi:dolichyl-phosphate-mannose-protein mannosyltransferase